MPPEVAAMRRNRIWDWEGQGTIAIGSGGAGVGVVGTGPYGLRDNVDPAALRWAVGVAASSGKFVGRGEGGCWEGE